MITIYHDFPDVEAMTVAYLKECGLAAGRVSTELPTKPVWPCLTVSRIGGMASPGRGLDLARVQVDAWGSSKSDARALIAAALTHLWQMPAAYTGAGHVTSVVPDLGMTWQPDDSVAPARPRYVAGVQITTY